VPKRDRWIIVGVIIFVVVATFITLAAAGYFLDKSVEMKATQQTQNTLYEPVWNEVNPGMKLVQFSINITNHRDATINLTPYGFSATSTKGSTYQFYYSPSVIPDRLEKGAMSSFSILFSIPSNENISKVIYNWDGLYMVVDVSEPHL
jgi:hypothetical protein